MFTNEEKELLKRNLEIYREQHDDDDFLEKKLTKILYDYLMSINEEDYLLLKNDISIPLKKYDPYLFFTLLKGELRIWGNEKVNDKNIGKIIRQNYLINKYINDFDCYINDLDKNNFLIDYLLQDINLHISISIPSSIGSYIEKNYLETNIFELCLKILKMADTQNIYDFIMEKYKRYNKKNIFEDDEILDFLCFLAK